MIIRGLETAAQGMQALIDQNDSTASNVANVNTTGYKKQRLVFKDIYESNLVERDDKANSLRTLGSLSAGSQVQKITYDFSQGVIDKTGNTFDIAIEGDGFFKVQQASDGSTSYTRNGSFTMDSQGYLVTKDGDYVLDEKNKRMKIRTNGVVMRSLNDIIINEDGQVELVNDATRVQMQKIGIFDFQNKEDMTYLGASKFRPTNPATNRELRAQKFKIEQGSIEQSNANVVNEMIKTISTSRNYEALSKMVKANGDSLTNVMNVGRL